VGRQTRALLVSIWAAVFWPNAGYTESHTTNKIDGTSVEVGGPYTLGDSGPFNFLIVTNGGAPDRCDGRNAQVLPGLRGMRLNPTARSGVRAVPV